MDPPTGIELHPKPPLTTRLRKRPGWIIFGLLLVVTLSVCYSVYERRDRFVRSPFDDHKSIEPATRAAREITKDIPPGVVNLADETKKSEKDNSRSGLQPPPKSPQPYLR